ncbi:FHA domain-containing protein [Aeromicrobium alkaliterrae]|uniref:FHA domain-containing protein n=1 Tax=Aeromicrobium alkaliterrae TaxID=302168 RepID=A0ABN2JK06_9ACTN
MTTPGGAPEPDPRDSIEHTTHIPYVDHDTEEMSAEDMATVEKLPTGSAMLLVQRGPEAGARFLLDAEEVTVGRHPESDIFLDDISVSRRHATFRREGKTFVVSDKGSLNGTYVNRDRIERDIVLAGGDEVQFGKFRLLYFDSTTPGRA